MNRAEALEWVRTLGFSYVDDNATSDAMEARLEARNAAALAALDDAALLEASMLLARVRDLHKPAMIYGLRACASCRELAPPYGWPCPTARIVYSETEIKEHTT